MNAGFSNLDFLKKQLLAGTAKSDTRFDTLIATLGRGVAQQFANLCNRKFDRVVNAQEIIGADRCQFSVARYPLESVSLVEIKTTEALGWQAYDAPPWTRLTTIELEAGILNFPADLGRYDAQVRITLTGGFFWETLEPDAASYPTAVPAGANVLPDDLLQIWLLQCRHIWGHLDKLGTDLLKNGDEKSLRFPQDYAPTVKENLAQFTRYNLA